MENIYQSFSILRGTATEDYTFKFLIFYTNGLVDQGDAAYFIEGPAALNLASEPVRLYHLGTYQVVGDQVHIAWLGAYAGQTTVYRRDGELLGELGGPCGWWRLPKGDGLALEGAYLAKGGEPGSIWLAFAPNGTLLEQGTARQAAGLYFLERGVEAPPDGGGTYTIQDWPLTMTYLDGTTLHMFFFVFPDDDLQHPRQIMLNTYFYELCWCELCG